MSDERDGRRRWNRPPQPVKNSRPRVKMNENGTVTISGFTTADALSVYKFAGIRVEQDMADRQKNQWEPAEQRAREYEASGDHERAATIRQSMATDREYYRWVSYLLDAVVEQIKPKTVVLPLTERLARRRSRRTA